MNRRRTPRVPARAPLRTDRPRRPPSSAMPSFAGSTRRSPPAAAAPLAPPLATLLVAGLAAAACGGGEAADVASVPVAVVRLAPEAVTVRVAGEASVAARALTADDREVTGRPVFWSVRDTIIATVTQAGVVRGLRAGTTELAASVQGRNAVARLTVTAPQVATVRLEPAALQLVVGDARPLTARVLDETGAAIGGSVEWASAAPQVATVNAAGELRAVGPGATTITATVAGRTGSAAVTVCNVPVASLRITPASETLAVGATRQLAATAFDAAGSALAGRTVGWSSRSPAVAVVSSTGLVTAVAVGTATIAASVEGASAEATIVVRAAPVAAVRLAPDRGTLAPGGTLALSALALDAGREAR